MIDAPLRIGIKIALEHVSVDAGSSCHGDALPLAAEPSSSREYRKARLRVTESAPWPRRTISSGRGRRP